MEQKIRRDLNMGANLRRLRDKADISQEKLCAELQRRGCDIGRTTYAKYESGELNIKVSVIIELKKIYNCEYDEFFEGLDVNAE
ncbi:MAG: helix-turn-helix transcriptional regulator [Clostridia bacterium]|nr:helix-turn-helix transcriptional regulator [Clostridia bacterium]